MNIKKLTLTILSILLVLNLSLIYVDAWPYFPSKTPQESEVPIVMYHLITNNSKYQGKFGISQAEMESDLKYLKENGYETIFISDLIDFVNRKQSLPKKPIILTFDDGCSSDFYYLLPLLEQYKMKAVLSIIGKVTDDYSNDTNAGKKPHLVWDQILQMQKSGLVEIQNHSYDLHGNNGSGKKESESVESFQERLKNDLAKAQEQIKDKAGSKPTAYTYPLGIISKNSKEVLLDLKFQASISCAEGMNIIKQGDPDCLFSLKRNIRRHNSPISDVLDRIEKQNKKIDKS